MNVVFVIIFSITLLWVFASRDFAISMTVFWVFFGLLELLHLLITHKTISQNFKSWAVTQETWRVWLVAGSLVVVAAYFMIHLASGNKY